MTKLTIIFLSLVIGTFCFAGGLVVGNFGFLAAKKSQQVNKTTIALLKSISNGGEITITEQEWEKVTQEKEYKGKNETKSLESGKTGLGATDVAAMDQGINNSSIGQVKGYGVLEKIWTYIKSSLWIIIAYFVIYGGFSAASLKIPVLGTIAKGMLAVATVGISGINWIFEYIKNSRTTTALSQTIQGIDKAKIINPKCKIDLNSELEKSQDVMSKKIVARMRNKI